jgi:hypothetical protein
MSIADLCEALYVAHDAYRSAHTARAKKARYRRMVECCLSLKTRLDEAASWMGKNMYTESMHDDVWIDVLHKYQRGWNALEQGQSWL